MNPAWVRSVRDQCQAARVAFLFKQWGEYTPVREPIGEALISIVTTGATGAPVSTMRRTGKKAAGRELDGREWSEFPTPKAA